MLKHISALTLLAAATAGISSTANAALPEKTACISMQGNGERYPSLAGQVQRLLELNIEPKVIYGGSSGSGISALIGSILDNPSLNNTEVFVDGRALSKAEKAARLVAASSEPNATIIVLPAVNQLGNTLRSVFAFLAADTIADAFIGYPDQALSLIEASSGQISLLAEFLGTADFSAALLEDNFAARNALVMDQWLNYADMLYVTPKEFIRALVTAPKDKRWTERSEEIKKRYFDLYYSENTAEENSPESARARYNRLLNRISFLINWVSDEQWERVFLGAIANLDGLPFLSYTAEILSKPFYLPNGEKIIDAYHARSGYTIPSTSIIHTSARIAEPFGRNGSVEKEGLENFYQVYFAGTNIAEDLLTARAEKAEIGETFIQYEDENGEVNNLLNPEQFVVVKQPLLISAIKTSIAEPNAFRRDPIAMSSEDVTNNFVQVEQDEKLITFGGWMENAMSSTLQSIEACRDVDYLVEVSNFSEGLFGFQLQAARAVTEGAVGSITNNLTGEGENDEATVFMNRLWDAFDYGRSQAGDDRFVQLTFNWDNASGETGELATALNLAYDKNRAALFALSYQSAFNELANDAFGRFDYPVDPALLGANLMAIELIDIKDPEEINSTVELLLNQ